MKENMRGIARKSDNTRKKIIALFAVTKDVEMQTAHTSVGVVCRLQA